MAWTQRTDARPGGCGDSIAEREFRSDKVYRRDDRGVVGVESLIAEGLAFVIIHRQRLLHRVVCLRRCRSALLSRRFAKDQAVAVQPACAVVVGSPLREKERST